MAIPRVFISSTCYDLKHIRQNLKYFVKTVGYEPVLSDEGDVFYSPISHTHDSCLREVETCQIFILIIGGRHGGDYKDERSSITNNEYREAVRCNIPIFALVESAVYSDHHVFVMNKKNNPTIANDIIYPSIDDNRIFGFIDEVRKNTKNNSIFPFRDFSDMESYLKKQWAGMMYDFITQRSLEEGSKITNRLLDDLTLAAKKSEELIKILLKSGGDNEFAEKTIEDVSNKVLAENFAHLILSTFNKERFFNATINELQLISLDQNLVDFLEATNEFYTEKCFDDSNGQYEDVLFGVGSIGVSIDDLNRRSDIRKSFEALRLVDEDTRKKIYIKMIEGI